jgi:hypothetical protein
MDQFCAVENVSLKKHFCPTIRSRLNTKNLLPTAWKAVRLRFALKGESITVTRHERLGISLTYMRHDSTRSEVQETILSEILRADFLDKAEMQPSE